MAPFRAISPSIPVPFLAHAVHAVRCRHDLYRGATAVQTWCDRLGRGRADTLARAARPGASIGTGMSSGPHGGSVHRQRRRNGGSSISGNIGAGILKRYIVTLDSGIPIMYLKPVTVASTTSTLRSRGALG